MHDMFDLSGNVALCTGGTSGLGRRMARALACGGADVALVGRRKSLLDDAAAEIADVSDRKVVGIEADLNDRSSIAPVVAQANDLLATVTILVNAAGINLREPANDITWESWDRTINLNLTVPFFLARECVPGMKRGGRGKIINIASLQSYRAFANSVPYGASKGGIAQLTRAMAEAWSADGILANEIAPGFFETELTAAVYEDQSKVEHNARMTAIGRNGLPEDIDGLTVFLASKASDYITGQVIPLDGGFTAK